METKSLLYGIIGFMLGGLLVSVAATTFDKPACTPTPPSVSAVTPASASVNTSNGDSYLLQTRPNADRTVR